MPEMTYAVHTTTCTYLLDDDGICRWTLSPSGLAAPGTDRCVGAQFVACLDLSAPGGLVGELVVGGAALFAHRENGRLVLLRTLPIERVEYRPGPGEAPESTTAVLGPGGPWAVPAHAVEDEPTPMREQLTEPLSMDAVEAARIAFASLAERESDADAVPLDLEDLLSISVTEVTVSLPLYRPPVPLPPLAAPPRRSTAPPPPPPQPAGWPRQEPPPPSPSQPARRGVIGPGRRLR